MALERWFIFSNLRRIIGKARGLAVPLANGLVEQISQFITTGMSIEMALRESLLLAIHAAKVRAQHCVGNERYPIDDFITSCQETHTLIENDFRVQVEN